MFPEQITTRDFIESNNLILQRRLLKFREFKDLSKIILMERIDGKEGDKSPSFTLSSVPCCYGTLVEENKMH